MKRLLFIGLLILTSCSQQRSVYAGERARVTTGFYKGCEGTVYLDSGMGKVELVDVRCKELYLKSISVYRNDMFTY